ncbi:MAG: GNAT family N-acetyltransferase [Ectothiorhodospiraceae bacterium]|nr:GNAT family N-acetyltransferase [Ectothiorhodospiraceae bacterium]
MRRSDLDIAIDWAAAEGWNPGLHDADAFLAADPGGYLIGEIDDEPVASISVVAYDTAFGFLGFYIVAPSRRGEGHGLAIWEAGMHYLGNRNVGLDGVVAQQPNYRRSGFRYAYGNQRFGGVAEGDEGRGTVPVGEVLIDDVLAYDRRCFPAARRPFLERWLSQPDGHALALPGANGLRGYGVVRKCRAGYKIGPLFADGPQEADQLYRALAGKIVGEMVYLDVPLPNVEAVALARRYGLEPSFETARMYTGPEPDVALDCTFGVTTFELG